MSRERLFIIDAHSQIYKAYYAIRRLSNSRGLPTNAIYGFVQMLNRLLREMRAHKVVAVFDHPAPSFREAIYKDYKANRPPMPDDLSTQIPWIKKILEAMKIHCIEMPGYEADDIIGSLARAAAAKNFDCFIVSADKDLFQLVGDRVCMLQLKNDKFEIVDRERVKERTNVYPEHIPDLIGLMGDSIDNIPGVPQIGPKTAAALLAQFGSLENLLAHLDRVNNERQRERLGEHKESAHLSKRLAIIDGSLPLGPVDLESLPEVDQASPTLFDYYRELEFKSLLKDSPVAPPAQQEATAYVTISTTNELREVVKRAGEARIVAIDTETTSANPFGAALVGISLSCEDKSACYVPIGHMLLTHGESLIALDQAKTVLTPLLHDPHIKKCFHNAKYDIEILENHGMRVEGLLYDTMVASYLLDPDRGGHGLKDLGAEILGVAMTPLSELIGKGKKAITMAEVALADAAVYACRDANVTLRLMKHFEPRLREHDLWDLYHDLELPLVRVLADMETHGVQIDLPYFRELSEEMGTKLDALGKDVFALAGHEFNLSSPKQVAEVLFNELKLRPVKSGKTGYSTDVGVLEELSASHPLPQRLLEYRLYEKLKSTYVDALPRLVNPRTNKIHTSYNQTIAATGRLSSSEPNLQNIPVRTSEGRKIRRGFIPGSRSNVLLAADYSQIELRILAHMSHDKNLMSAFRDGADIHKLTASRIFGCPAEMVTPEMRDQAKVINFGVIYGMTAHRLARDFKIPQKAAQAFIDDYFAAHPGVKRWMDQTLRFATETGYVLTMLKRRRYVPNITSRNRSLHMEAQRIAINTPIQGTSADMIKRAMIRIHQDLQTSNFRTRMIMQVHDELIFDAPKDEIDRVSALIKQHMERALALDVPIRVDVKWGNNWAEC